MDPYIWYQKKKNIVKYPYLIGINKKIVNSSLMIAKGYRFESVLATLSYADISTQSYHNRCHLDHQQVLIESC